LRKAFWWVRIRKADANREGEQLVVQLHRPFHGLGDGRVPDPLARFSGLDQFHEPPVEIGTLVAPLDPHVPHRPLPEGVDHVQAVAPVPGVGDQAVPRLGEGVGGLAAVLSGLALVTAGPEHFPIAAPDAQRLAHPLHEGSAGAAVLPRHVARKELPGLAATGIFRFG
jgi:hypothetical protein